MSRESPAFRYLRLSKEFGKKYNEEIERLTKEINEQLNEAIHRELDALETALKTGDIVEAYYHKMKAEILSSSVLP